MSAMDHFFGYPTQGLPDCLAPPFPRMIQWGGATTYKMQSAMTYIFILQQPTFWVCNLLHFYYTLNTVTASFSHTGGVLIHDINYYKKENRLPRYYNVNWGFEDQKLYQFAKEDITELAADESPFFYGMLTVDTHPNGYICDLCDKDYAPGEEYQAVFECGDRQVDEFVKWAQEQDWYEDTLIVLMGDHTMPQECAAKIYPDGYDDSRRKWIDVFVNADQDPDSGLKKDRKFCSVDMFPTILEAMGVSIDGHGLGFGRSLFSAEPTLMEQMPVSEMEDEMNTICTQYIYWETGEYAE